jgi:NDP-sugar pyrophosphorylase family protein/aminoglycoside/choline kinase family phosphotransferase
VSVNLFIASAGYGSRLRPVTDLYPKPLLPIAGQKLIDRMIDRVCIDLDINEIAINVHYKKESFEQWGLGKGYQFFEEEELLGTGGALWNAARFFQKQTSLLINGDVLTDFDWQGMLKEHRESGNLVTLAVQDREHERRVGANANDQFICIDKTMQDPRVDHWFGYACVVLYEPGFLKYLPEGESHVVPYWEEALQAGERVGVYDIGKDAEWLDLGNVHTYAAGVFASLKEDKRFFVEPLNVPWDCQIDSYCVIEEDVDIGKNVSLSNVILLSGAVILDGSELKNCIVGPGMEVGFTLSEMKLNTLRNKIGNGGSDRLYSRFTEGVCLDYSIIDHTIERQKDLTNKLLNANVSVPEIYQHRPKARQLILEDLGDQTFRLWAEGKTDDEILEQAKRCLDELLKFQFIEEPLQDKPFNLDVLRWESSYFLERFIFRFTGLHEEYESNKTQIDEECLRMAKKVHALDKVLMHRDFQSENVMIKGGEVFLIDFQGAHYGPSLYDAASFIGDPYMDYSEEIQEELKSYFYTQSKNYHELDNEWVQNYDLCAIQRHMQALGAYGFLSKIKGKQSFEQYIPQALLMLNKNLEANREDYEGLYTLSQKAIEKLKVTGA